MEHVAKRAVDYIDRVKLENEDTLCNNYFMLQLAFKLLCNMVLVFCMLCIFYISCVYYQKLNKKLHVSFVEKSIQTVSHNTQDHSTQTNRRYCTRLMYNREIWDEVSGEGEGDI